MGRLTLGLLAIVAVVLAVGLTGSRTSGRRAPALPGHTLSGAPASLPTLRGEPVLVSFFASWCGPCVAEAPTLARADRALQGQAHVVAVDWSDSTRYARAFIRRFGWKFTVLDDPNGRAGYAYRIQGLPSTFVLDPQGRIVVRLIGPQKLVTLLRAVRRAGRE